MDYSENDLMRIFGGSIFSSRDVLLKRVAERLEKEMTKFALLLPEELYQDFYDHSFIAGGALYCLYNGQEPKDYDFFLDKQEVVNKIRNFFEMQSSLHYTNGVKKGRYKNKTLIVTDNAISVGDYQIITRFVGTPKEVIGEFDFKHNMYYYHKKKVENLVSWDYIEDTKLVFNDGRVRDICGTIIRVKKFVERGFTITNKEMAKMLLKLHEVGFNERELEILNAHDERNDFGS